MRVLFATHNFPRWPGDHAGSFLLRLAIALRARGVEVHVVAPSAPGLPAHDIVEGIPVERFRYAPGRLESLAYGGAMVREARRGLGLTLAAFLAAERRAIRRAARTFRPALVHAHWWFPSGLVATHAGTGLPIVTSMHGTDVRLARDVALLRPLMRRTLRRSAAVTAVSSWLAGEARAAAPAATVEVVHMPVNAPAFTPPPAGTPRSGLLFVGRLNAQKGIATLVDALPLMRRREPLTVLFAGGGREPLAARAATLGVADRIRWVDAVPQPELAAHYRQAAALVVPSVDEGLGLVAVEGQLCETPVVASDSGGLRDIVRDGVSGVTVAPGDPARLAAALDALLAREDRGAALGAAGRRESLAQFSPESIGARFAAIYREVATRAA